ncbi:MAG: DUF192 domain-containing protein [Acidimicrobiia bacterium]|nr:DUF192 domain-containing protein [Acidimicrobiia bacterium]MBP8181536.1 DUF192 domain-containing protein [Acidimicrobiia bacterium]
MAQPVELADAFVTLDGEPLAHAVLALDRSSRRRGARGVTQMTDMLVLPKTRHVHTFGCKVSLGIAFCGEDGTVLKVQRMEPRRMSSWVPKAKFVVEWEWGSIPEDLIVEGRSLAVAI